MIDMKTQEGRTMTDAAATTRPAGMPATEPDDLAAYWPDRAPQEEEAVQRFRARELDDHGRYVEDGDPRLDSIRVRMRRAAAVKAREADQAGRAWAHRSRAARTCPLCAQATLATDQAGTAPRPDQYLRMADGRQQLACHLCRDVLTAMLVSRAAHAVVREGLTRADVCDVLLESWYGPAPQTPPSGPTEAPVPSGATADDSESQRPRQGLGALLRRG